MLIVDKNMPALLNQCITFIIYLWQIPGDVLGEIRKNYVLFWVSKTLIFIFTGTLSKQIVFDFTCLKLD